MIQMRIYKLQDKGCILIKILQCMFYTSRIVKFSAFFYDLAAFPDIPVYDLMKVICKRIFFLFIIMIKRHSGNTGTFYNIGYPDLFIWFFIHQGKNGFSDAHPRKTGSVCIFFPK